MNISLSSSLQPLRPMEIMEASSSFFVSASTMLSRFLPAILSTISYAITSLATLLLPMAAQLQRAGETMLAALLLLSMIQALVALYQYRYDSRGQLVFPNGLTIGEEDCYSNDHLDSMAVPAKDNDDKNAQSKESTESSNVASTPPNATAASTAMDKINSSWAEVFVKKMNRSLVLLLPWITRNVHNILTKNTHLFHIGFIVFILDSLLPFMLDGESKAEAANDEKLIDKNASKLDSGTSSLLRKMSSSYLDQQSRQDPLRVIVIGDSLSIGIGCIEHFDATKDNTVPMALVQKTVLPREDQNTTYQGPVFPKVLAQTLSYHFQRPVQWRSAGVDGGDINDIRSFCMDVVKEESLRCDGNIDIVVVLFGMNDLKKVLSVNPIQHLLHRNKDTPDEGGTNQFRHGMEMLLSDVHSQAPNALVVFPALPVQPFHKNSIINIFPLGMCVDSALGLWERQKRVVAKSSKDCIFVELSTREISDWYSSNKNNNGISQLDNSLPGDSSFRIAEDFDSMYDDDVLLSADGVHPNGRMYAKWAKLVGQKLYKHIFRQFELLDQSHGRLSRAEIDTTKETKRANLEYET